MCKIAFGIWKFMTINNENEIVDKITELRPLWNIQFDFGAKYKPANN